MRIKLNNINHLEPVENYSTKENESVELDQNEDHFISVDFSSYNDENGDFANGKLTILAPNGADTSLSELRGLVIEHLKNNIE